MSTTRKSANFDNSKITAAEMKANFESMSRFEDGNDALRNLVDLKKITNKNIRTFDKETLRQYLENIGGYSKELRALSWFLYYRSQVYARICNFYANMFCLDCRSIIPNYDMFEQKNNDDKMLKSFQDTANILSTLRLQDEFYNIFLTCFVQDVFYGVVFYDETGIFIYPFPADYARISGKYMTGDFSYAIDCSYFNRYPKLLDWYPEPFKTLYDKYKETNEKWQVMPKEYSLCMKFRSEDYETVVPPLTPVFNSIINLLDLEDIQAIAAEQEIYKMIWFELETISGSKKSDDWKINPALAVNYFNKMVDDSLPDYISAAIVPGKLNEISFPDDQASDTNKVANATETVLNTAGGAEILNGSTINNTYAFKMACIQNTEYAISSLLPQCQSWVNRFIAQLISNPSRVKFFPVSVYTKADYMDQLLKSGQNGLPTVLSINSFNGFSEKETLAMNYFEQNILDLKNRLKPLSTSYTESSTEDGYTSEVGQGAPQKDAGDLSDSGERSRNQ